MNNQQKLFDLTFLEQMDDESFISEVITLYIHDTKLDLDDMKQAFAKSDFDKVCQVAHKLKSSTGMLQANVLSIVLEQIEVTAKAGRDKNEIGKLVQMAGREFDLLKVGLQEHLRTMGIHA